MTTTYPVGVDDFAESSPTNLGDVDSSGRSHSERHDDVESAVVAVESTLGVNPQGLSATVDERIGAVEHGLFFGGGSPRRVEAERLLSEAVWWVDAADSGSSSALGRNLGWGGSGLDAVQATSGNQPKYLAWQGENYVYLPGVPGNYLSVPDEAGLDITGDLEIVCRIAFDDWTPASNQNIINKYDTVTTVSYYLRLNTAGTLSLLASPDGTSGATGIATSSAATGVTDGSAKWIKVTFAAATSTVKFYLADDSPTVPTSWTQLGTDRTMTGVTSIYASTSTLKIGTDLNSSNAMLIGKVHRAIIKNGINGTPVLDVDCSQITSGSSTSFTARTGQQVSINRGSSGRKAVAVTQPCWLFGTDDYLTVADNDLLDFGATDSFTLMAVVRQWATPTPSGRYLAKQDTGVGYSLRSNGTAIQGSLVMYDAVAAITANGPVGTAGGTSTIVGMVDRATGLAATYLNATAGATVSASAFGSSASSLALMVGRRATTASGYQDFEGIAFAVFRKALTQYEIELLNDYYQQRDSGQPDAYQPKKYVNEAALPVGEQGDLAFNETSQQLLVKQGGSWNDVVTAKSALRVLPEGEPAAEKLLRQAVWWIDASEASAGEQTVRNLGWGGSALDAQVGSTTGADSNDPKYLDWQGENYVYLPGVNYNGIWTAHNSALTTTSDLDIQLYGSWGWLQGIQYMASKRNASLEWYFMNVGDNVYFRYTDTVTGDSNDIRIGGVNAWGTAANWGLPILPYNQKVWLRFTLDADNGNGQYVVAAWWRRLETDSWTRIAQTTGSQVASIAASTNGLTVFGANNGSSNGGAVSAYRAKVAFTIDGPPVLDVDCSQITSGADTSFTALTGQTVTINRSTSGRKTVGVVHPRWLFGTDDYMEVPARHVGLTAGEYFRLPGVSGSYLSVPDEAALDITGDIDIRMNVAADDWTVSGSEKALIHKWSEAAGNASYALNINPAGYLKYYWSADGTSNASAQSTAVVPAADGSALWLRVTHDVDNGAVGNDVKFYTSSDGVSWTQLGTTVTTAGVASIYAGTSPLSICATPNGNYPIAGRIYRAEVYDGIGGTLVLAVDGQNAEQGDTSFTCSTGQTVTVNGSVQVVPDGGLFLPGLSGNYASTPDSAALDITGDLDLRARASWSWTSATSVGLVSKWNGGTNQRSYVLMVQSGKPWLYWSPDGATVVYEGATTTMGVADWETMWVRATLDVDNGAGAYEVNFYMSPDGIVWTQIGSTVTGGATTSIFNSTSLVNVGAYNTGTQWLSTGPIYRTQILNGIDGTVVFDADFTDHAPGTTSFTEDSTNAATVTINTSGSSYRATLLDRSSYVFPVGAPVPAAKSLLDFGGGEDFTAVVAARWWANGTSYGTILAKRSQITGYGYSFDQGNATANGRGIIQPTSGSSMNTAGSNSYGSLGVFAVRRESGSTTVVSNGVSSSATSSVTGDLTNSLPLRVGRMSDSTIYADMEGFFFAVFRRALTEAELLTLTDYAKGRAA